MFERFSTRARRVIVLAQDEAKRFNHNYIGTEHLLLGLIREAEGVGDQAVGTVGLDLTLDKARDQVESIVGYGEGGFDKQAPFTPLAKKALELAHRDAIQLGHNYVGTEHVLLELVREEEGIAWRVLKRVGADPEKVRREVVGRVGERVRNKHQDPSKRAASLFLENQSMKKEIRRLRAQVRKLQASAQVEEAS